MAFMIPSLARGEMPPHWKDSSAPRHSCVNLITAKMMQRRADKVPPHSGLSWQSRAPKPDRLAIVYRLL